MAIDLVQRDVNPWLRIALGGSYNVTQFDILPYSAAEDRILDWELYVTDSTSTAKADWGTPAESGRWDVAQSATQTVTVDPPARGKYAILYVVQRANTGRLAGAMEVWVYGGRMDSYVTDFSVADRSTGSGELTNSATVDVSIMTVAGVGAAITGYQITDTPDAPDPDFGWSSTMPATATIIGDQGLATLWAWVKDGQGSINGRAASILYSTSSPAATAVQALGQSDTSAWVIWTTAVPCFGRLSYSVDGGANDVTAYERTMSTSHSRLMAGLMIGSVVDFTIENNESAQTLRQYTHEGGASEIAKSGMTATASSMYNATDFRPEFSINNDLTDQGWLAAAGGGAGGHWLRIDMGLHYRVQRFSHVDRGIDHGRVKQWELYVTDSESTNRADWGAPAASGIWPNATVRRYVDVPPRSGAT